jgi:hypothetical protein
MPAVIASLSFDALAIRSLVQVRRPEGLRDDDLGVGQLAFEHRVRTVLVGRDHELVAGAFEEFP